MKHDSWAILKTGTRFDPILEKFPQGIPLRDPFPSIFLIDPNNGASIAAWEVDMKRLDFNQACCLIKLFVETSNFTDVMQQGIALNNRWIESIRTGVEGFNRALEFRSFLEFIINPQAEDLQDFLLDQEERWVRGREIPDLSKLPPEGIDVRALSQRMKQFYHQLSNPKPLEDSKAKVVGLVDTDLSPEKELITIRDKGVSILELSSLRLTD